MEEKFECKECRVKYHGAACGQGFTQFTCKKCGQIAWYHNTLTPNYCTTCSETYYLCQRCGKDLLLEAILAHKEKTNLYDVALEIGCSEYSLRKYIEKGTIGDRVRKKIIKWYERERENGTK